MRRANITALVGGLLVILAVPTLALAQRVPVDFSAQVGGNTAEVMVKTATVTYMPSASATPGTSTALAGRRALEIQNNGPNDLWCAIGTALAPPAPVISKARRIPALGGVWNPDLGSGVLVACVAAVADQVTGAATSVSEVK